MCIAILNSKGILCLKTFQTCWTANPDGAGLCYFDGEKIQTFKEMKSVKNFHQHYMDVRAKFPKIDIAIHFRISTHGRVNITNCHPFKINKTTAFIHNGVISNMGVNSEFSDTYIFNKTIMQSLPSNFVQNNAVMELIENYIGYSKLVIISGKISAIANESLGLWDGGNWYSNKSYLPEVKKEVTKTTHQNSWMYYDAWDYDLKSKAYVNLKKEEKSLCECCREHTTDVNFVHVWGMDICGKCYEQFTPESDKIIF